jgi:VCBS repeat-containing protein
MDDSFEMDFDKAGVTTNATSFTNADSAYPIKVNFTIPTAQENDYAASYKYAEDILQSMLGYLSLNNSLEYEYKIFDTISTTNEITSSDIIEDSFGQEINYKDLVYQLVAYNIHCNSTDFQATSSATAKNEKTRFLHGVTNTDRFVHVLEDITTRINDLLAVRSERQARYVFSTKTKNLDSIIGDKYLLTRTGFVQRPIQILAVDKSSKEVDIIATDFIGI